jgi:Fe-S cluster biogenesis protein NfuA
MPPSLSNWLGAFLPRLCTSARKGERITIYKKNPLKEKKMSEKIRSKKEIMEDIQKILKDSILPTVEMHGGHVSLKDFKDGIAIIFMSGACSGCAMSSQTLHMGIENMLTYYIPEVTAVQGLEDPNSTVSPYYQ